MIIRKFHRRNLPHLYYNDGTYFITYRLAGTIPITVLKQFQKELAEVKDKEELSIKQKRIFKKYDNYLDNTFNGFDYLTKNEFTQIVKMTLHIRKEKITF